MDSKIIKLFTYVAFQKSINNFKVSFLVKLTLLKSTLDSLKGKRK